MTETEWLNGSDPGEVTSRATVGDDRYSCRKWRLLAVAACRQVGIDRSDLARSLLAWVEGAADGDIDPDATKQPSWHINTSYILVRVWEQAVRAAARGVGPADTVAAARLGYAEAAEFAAHFATCKAAGLHPAGIYPYYPKGHPGFAAWTAVRKGQAGLVRCVLGNPFRPVVLDPSWLTPTVVSLARGVYADSAFDRLPILADALEDAGCDSRVILDHLRGPGPHVRGCWALDLILGKQ
jgi:hypothetical protein